MTEIVQNCPQTITSFSFFSSTVQAVAALMMAATSASNTKEATERELQ